MHGIAVCMVCGTTVSLIDGNVISSADSTIVSLVYFIEDGAMHHA